MLKPGEGSGWFHRCTNGQLDGGARAVIGSSGAGGKVLRSNFYWIRVRTLGLDGAIDYYYKDGGDKKSLGQQLGEELIRRLEMEVK